MQTTELLVEEASRQPSLLQYSSASSQKPQTGSEKKEKKHSKDFERVESI